MVDVAMATSAAPAYFAAAHVDGHRLVDGGVWANNPSVVGITEAVSMLGVPLAAVAVLNIGTMDQVSHHDRRLDTGGLVTWARQTVPLVLTAGSRGAQGIAEHLAGRHNYSRSTLSCPAGSTGWTTPTRATSQPTQRPPAVTSARSLRTGSPLTAPPLTHLRHGLRKPPPASPPPIRAGQPPDQENLTDAPRWPF
jgi:hypothetical protein